jgi:PKD repeat protein
MKNLYPFTFALLFAANSCKKPTACFSLSKPVAKVNELVIVENCSENAEAFCWDFDDNPYCYSATKENFSHIYSTPGNYTITLYAINPNATTSQSLGIIIVP